MAKPSLDGSGLTIPTFDYWVQRVLPAVYDDTLSYMELLSKTVAHLNDIGVKVNILTDLWNEVNEWVMGEGINTTINTRLDEMVQDGSLDVILEGMQRLYLTNEGSTDTEYQFELANFGSPDGTLERTAFVIHHYNDREMMIMDNVCENNVIMLLRNATNSVRRPDKDPEFVGSGDFLRAQGRYKNGSTWQAVTLFEVKANGDLQWSNKGPLANDGVRLVNDQPSSNGNFAFTLQNNVRNEYILKLQHEEGKDSLFFTTNVGERMDIYTSNLMNGMKIWASEGNLELGSGAGDLIQLLNPVFSKTTTGWAQMGRFVGKPTSQTSVGERGDYFCDINYLYVCIGTNMWERIAVDQTSW